MSPLLLLVWVVSFSWLTPNLCVLIIVCTGFVQHQELEASSARKGNGIACLATRLLNGRSANSFDSCIISQALHLWYAIVVCFCFVHVVLILFYDVLCFIVKWLISICLCICMCLVFCRTHIIWCYVCWFNADMISASFDMNCLLICWFGPCRGFVS